jgi:hypothetical protein
MMASAEDDEEMQLDLNEKHPEQFPFPKEHLSQIVD